MISAPISQTLFRVVNEVGDPIGLADFKDVRKAFKAARACANKGKCNLSMLRIEQTIHFYSPVYPEI